MKTAIRRETLHQLTIPLASLSPRMPRHHGSLIDSTFLIVSGRQLLPSASFPLSSTRWTVAMASVAN